MISKTVEECWQVAFDEAERYQEEANNLKQHVIMKDVSVFSHEWTEVVENVKVLIAKRDAASLIARLIKYGESAHDKYIKEFPLNDPRD